MREKAEREREHEGKEMRKRQVLSCQEKAGNEVAVVT
jgi:hypothetical protein